jgi:hypothetical protein
MPNLKPFRDFSQHDVVNLFSYGGTAPVNAGTLVKIDTNWKNTFGESLSLQNLSSTPNTMSASFEPVGKVTKITNHNEAIPLGILLKNVREYDENGTPLIYEPQLLAERDFVLPEQAVPVLIRGMIVINDIDTTNRGNGGGWPVLGAAAYVGSNGRIATDGIIKVGQFYSTVDEQTSNGYCLLKLNIQ